jgi:hypothetical protein
VQAPALAAEGGFGTIDCRAQHAGAGCERHVIEVAREDLPIGIGDLAAEELVERAAREGAKGVGVDVVQRHADDAARRDEAAGGQVVQAGQQLAPRQVTGGAEEHHNLRKSRSDAGGNLGHFVLSAAMPHAGGAD